MKFIKVFDYIGHIGLYQGLLYLMLVLFPFFNGFHNLSSNFFAAHQDHWCYIPRLENFSFDTQRYVAVPYLEGSGEEGEYDSCSMYDLDYESLTDEEVLTWNRTEHNFTDTIPCSSWVFDQSEFISTINSQASLLLPRRAQRVYHNATTMTRLSYKLELI